MKRFLKCLWLILLLPLPAIAAQGVKVNIGGITGQLGYSETQLEIVMQDILNAKLHNFGVEIDITLYPSKEKLDQAYEDGLIDGIFSDPVVALTHADTYLKRAFLNLHYNDAPPQDALLVLVNKKAGIKSLKQLKGKKATFYADNRLEQAYLETLLLKEKLGSIDRFFTKSFHVKNGQVALLDVFFGKSDVTLVPKHVLDTAGELNPQLNNSLMVLAKSDAMVTRVVMIRDLPKYKPIFKDLVSKGAFDSRVRTGEMKFMTIEPTNFDALNSVNALLKEHKKLKKQ